MEFDYTEEQLAIQDSLQRWLAKNYAFDRRRAVLNSASGMSDEAWNTYAEMGVLALPLPEAAGGLGGTGVDLSIVMEQLGTALALEPYVPTVVLGAGLIAQSGDETQRDELLAAVVEGKLRLAFAHQEPGTRYTRQRVRTSAVGNGGDWTLTGHKGMVVGAPQAGKLIVSARTSGDEGDAAGISLFIVDAQGAGVTLRPYANHDGQRAAEVVLTQAPAELLGAADGAWPAIERALDRATIAVCAEAVGVMTAMNATTLDYLKTRKQFGVPIGSFQALQHRMADMIVAAEQARSMVTLGAVKIDSDDVAERSRVVSAVKAYVGQQSRFVGQQAIQLHGGMGLTEEMLVSHYFKRLTLIGVSFGDVDHHFDRFSRSLLEEALPAAV